MLRWPVTHSCSMKHTCTMFPHNLLCCGLLTKAQHHILLWLSAVNEQILSLILWLLIHPVLTSSIGSALAPGKNFISFWFRPPAPVPAFKDHFTRGRCFFIRFLSKLLGIGFIWSCERNMENTGCGCCLQWFPCGVERMIRTDKKGPEIMSNKLGGAFRTGE